MTATEQSEGWELLFDGTSTSLWRGYNRDTLPITWQAQDGKFSLLPGEGSGDIITKEKYSNFEFQTDFMLTDSANSGILYFVKEEADKTIWQNAPEYQLLDDATYIQMYGAEQMKKHLTGDNYDLQSAPASYLKPIGTWNTAKIVVNNGKVTHYLNGNKTIEYEVNSESFKNLVANSKFKEYPNFAQAKEGYIGLQDHGHPIYFKNIKVRKL
ncbi:MAG: DUF1080 domain-containing protein [Saprospiraceae bacterium]|nr:DUF1080 domain-containing protein [Saprospiraceae bacterium]